MKRTSKRWYERGGARGERGARMAIRGRGARQRAVAVGRLGIFSRPSGTPIATLPPLEPMGRALHRRWKRRRKWRYHGAAQPSPRGRKRYGLTLRASERRDPLTAVECAASAGAAAGAFLACFASGDGDGFGDFDFFRFCFAGPKRMEGFRWMLI